MIYSILYVLKSLYPEALHTVYTSIVYCIEK